MDEGGVDDAVGLTGAFGEALGIAQLAPAHLDTLGRKPGRALVAARQPDHLVAAGLEVLDDDLADKSGRSGDKHTHLKISMTSQATTVGHGYIVVK